MSDSRNFGRDLILLMFLVSGIALLFAAIIWLIFQALSSYSRAVDYVARDAGSVTPQVIEALDGRNLPAAEDALRLLVSHGENEAVAIYTSDGEKFAGVTVTDREPAPSLFGGKHGTHLENFALVHTVALLKNTRHLGTLYLRTSLYSQFEQFLYNIAMGVLVVGVVFIFTMFFALRLQRRISRPIENLISTARVASSGNDYSIRVDIDETQHGELAELINAFNALLIKIDDSNQELERSTQYYKMIMDQAADSIYVHDVHGKILDVNASACQRLGYSRNDLLGMQIADIERRLRNEDDFQKDNETPVHVKGVWRKLADGDIKHATVDGENICRDGTSFPVEVRLTTVRAFDTTCILAVARDVTEHQKGKAELQAAKVAAEEASQVKSQFLANMSHEIRTPMNAVIGLTDLLMETILTRRQREYVRTIRNSGDLLLSVIDDILDFSKLDAGISLHVQEFRIEDVIGGVVDILGYAAHSRQIELICQIDSRLSGYSVMGDSDRLRQILMNLVGNAVKFTDTGHVMLEVDTVSESEDEITLQFQVTDTGIGFSQDAKEKIFTPFTQVDTSTRRRHMGTGLGLPITKHLIELMDGHIDVRSTPGEGSVFWFTICFEKVEQDEKKENPLEDMRVLIVDRYYLVTEAAGRQLSALGMRPSQANDSSRVLNTLLQAEAENEPFSLVLIDSEASPVDGITLAREIRAERRINSKLGLVITTSIARPLKPSIINSIDRVMCLSKPLLPGSLRDAAIDATIGGGSTQEPPKQETEQYRTACEDLPTLVVEDNPVSREMLLKMLTVFGCEADDAGDGKRALENCGNKTYQLMLLDCQMPEMDGYEVATRIRKQEQAAGNQQHMTIIAVTANASSADQARCLQAGFDDYLPKPVRLMALQKVLMKWFPERFRTPVSGDTHANVSETSESKVDDSDAAEQETRLGDTVPMQPVSAVLEETQPLAIEDETDDTDEVLLDSSAWECFLSEPEKLAQLFELFTGDAEASLAKLAGFDSTVDKHILSRAAHALKSGCLQIGAKGMAEFCRSMEMASTVEEALAYRDPIQNEFKKLRRVLAETVGRDTI